MVPCRHCGKLFHVQHLFSKCERLCSWKCAVEYDDKAQASGGYHVVARDKKIAELQAQIRELLTKIPFTG